MRARTAAVAFVLLGLVGCSSDADVAQEEGATSADTSSAAPTTTDTTAPPAVIEPLLDGAAVIVPSTPANVDSLRPVLAWEPIDGAASYTVVVLDDADGPYWMWTGPDAEVPLGGAESSDFGIGPIIGTDYSWSVAAFDVDGALLAVSGQIPISTS